MFGASLVGCGPSTLHVRAFKSIPVCEFPTFLPKEVENIKDPFARRLASRIERLPVQVGNSDNCIMSSCVKPIVPPQKNPVVLLHGFDSSCLEWRYTLPMLEDAGLETWAVDVLGWGFSDLEKRPSCDVISKRAHLYQFWKTYINRPMILVGPSLGAAIAIDLVTNHPETVEKMVFIDASVYAEGTGDLAKLPRMLAYAGVYVLKSVAIRLYAITLAFKGLAANTYLDWMNRLHCELPNAIIRQIPNCGHLPHVEKPDVVTKMVAEFIEEGASKPIQYISV